MENQPLSQSPTQLSSDSPLPQSQPSTLPPVVKKNNGLMKTIGVVILIVAVGVAAYFAGVNNRSIDSNPPITVTSPTPTAQTMNSNPTGDSTVDWNVYTHSSFTFKYPSDVKLTPENPDSVTLVKNPGQPQLEGFSNGINLGFTLIDLKKGQTLEEYVDAQIAELKSGPGPEVTEGKKKINLNSYWGFTYTTTFEGTWKNTYLQSPFSSSTVIMIVDGSQDPNSQGYRAIADQILSTFRFTNQQSVPTSGIKAGDNELIKTALFQYYKLGEGDSLRIRVETNDGKYASGTADNGYFFAVKVSNNWKVLAAGNGVIFCSSIAKYPDYPKNLIPECFDEVTRKSVTR